MEERRGPTREEARMKERRKKRRALKRMSLYKRELASFADDDALVCFHVSLDPSFTACSR